MEKFDTSVLEFSEDVCKLSHKAYLGVNELDEALRKEGVGHDHLVREMMGEIKQYLRELIFIMETGESSDVSEELFLASCEMLFEVWKLRLM